jgi:glycosyltransferase involved in cell wall biosynthesis/Flp pilus assembly protein TadD
MKKIALIVDAPLKNGEAWERLNRLSADLAHFGGEAEFFGAEASDKIHPLSELRNFQGAVIDLSDALAKEKSSEIPQGIDKLKVTIKGVFLDKSGYALHTRNLALGLAKLGANVELDNLWFAGAPDMRKVDPKEPRQEGFIYLSQDDGSIYKYTPHADAESVKRIAELCRKKSPPEERILLTCLPPAGINDQIYRRTRLKNPGFQRYIGFTMFEGENLPKEWIEGCQYMEEIWVPTKFNYDTFIRAGVPKEKLRITPLGVDTKVFNPDMTLPMQIPGVKGFNFLSVFQWTKRKGWDILLKAYLKAFTKDDDVALVIRSYYRNDREAESLVRNYIESLGYKINDIPRISVISQPLRADLMPSLYKACQAFVLPTRGEGWGLPYLEAMAMGLPTIGTRFGGNLEFMRDDNSYLIDNLGIEPVDEEQIRDNPLYFGTQWGIPSLEHTIQTMRRVYEHPEEARMKASRARQEVLKRWTVEHQVVNAGKVLLERNETAETKPFTEIATPQIKASTTSKPLRVVMQNRPNCLEAPGGDTVVMQMLKREMERMGVKVDFKLDLGGVEDYDIVHIFNFVLPEMVKLYAENAQRHQKPCIITPMYEDWPLFLNKSFKAYYLFKEYIAKGQPRAEFAEIFAPLHKLKAHLRADNSFNIRLASGLTPSGASEALRIQNEYPHARNVIPVFLGCDISPHSVGPELFIKETGLKDFVLCVGRLETRKNQLMLLKAVEDDDIPLVFATGGFTYQSSYADLCQRFKRRGQTVFLGRLSDEMLVSAYQSAKVHALPSFYELPGMVSVEAGHYNCNVVASPWGTIKDYLGELAFYAEPDDPEKLRHAILKALVEPVNPALKERIKQFTWERSAQTTLEVYRKAIAEFEALQGHLRQARRMHEIGREAEALSNLKSSLEIHPDNIEALTLSGEIFASQKDPQAEVCLQKLRQIDRERQIKVVLDVPRQLEDGFAFTELNPVEEGLLMLRNGAFHEAEKAFKTALTLNSRDARALYGLGRLCFLRNDYPSALEYLQKSTDLRPEGDSLILYAEVLEKLNRADQAMTALDLLKELPGMNGDFDFDYHRIKGHCFLRKGDFASAEHCYLQALQIDSASEKPYLSLASLELLRGKFEIAEKHLNRALKLAPNSDKAYLGLGLLRMEQGEAGEAIKFARQALDLNIDNQQAMMLLVRASHNAGKLSQAEQYLSKYAELHPANADIVYTLAGIRHSMGLREQALSAAEQVLMFHPDHRPAAELIEQMG